MMETYPHRATRQLPTLHFARHGIELARMGEEECATKFNTELSRAVRHLPRRREAAQALIDMHKRHGATVQRVLAEQLQRHGEDLIKGLLPASSMLALIAGQQHLASSWKRYGDRIAGLLQAGVPKACATHKPKDEPHLQQICDGILQAHDHDLTREYPFMRWSSSLTKPDWSAEPLHLWVELKYVRQKADIRPITEAIAADITKYVDNDRRVLYVVYDPNHYITDECVFAEPMERRPGMWVRFIR